MSKRAWSILLTVASILAPAFVLIRARGYVSTYYDAIGIPIEGKAVLGSFAILAAASCALCVAGLITGMVAYRRLSSPRSIARLLELLLLGAPLLLWIWFAPAIYSWVLRGQ